MLNIAYTEGEQRLLEAADIAEGNKEYNQGRFQNRCGTPGCMLGGYAAAHPENWAFKTGDHIFSVIPYRIEVGPFPVQVDFGSRRHATAHSAMLEFGITAKQYDDIFGGFGCGDAGSDGKAAAKWLRNWVYEHAKARIAA